MAKREREKRRVAAGAHAQAVLYVQQPGAGGSLLQ